MTDRYKSLIVTLTHDIRDDDCERIIQAIEMIQCVLKVEGNVARSDDYEAQERVRRELRKKLFEVLD